MLQLEDVLWRLHKAEINCRVQPTPPAHIAAVIDLGGGEERQRDFDHREGSDAIARWLDAMARQYFGGRYA